MPKSEVYSWRLSPATKQALEEVARQERTTVATLLEQIVIAWLTLDQAERNQDESEQRRLHAAAARSLGTIRGANPHRSEHVRDAIRARLSKRHAH